MWWNVDHGTKERTKLEWVVEAKAGAGSSRRSP